MPTSGDSRVNLDNPSQLTFSDNVASVLVWFGCFALFNIILISSISNCNALLTGAPICAASDSPSCSGMSGLQPTKSGPHNPIAVRVSLPVATCIKFMSLVLTYRVLAGSAPSYFNNLVQAHATARPLGLA